MKSQKILLLPLFLLISAATFAQGSQREKSITFPDNQIGKIVQEFIAVVNSADSNKVTGFVNAILNNDLANIGTQTWDKAKYLQMIKKLQKQAVKLSPVDLRTDASNNYLGVIFATAQPGKMLGIEFMKHEDLNTLKSLEVHAMSQPAGPYKWREGNLSNVEIVEEIKKRIAVEMNTDNFCGNILIAKNDSVFYSGSYGFSDRGKGIKNDVNTRFHTASLGKMITGVAVAQLVEKGLLKFSDKLGDLLKDYPNLQAHSVTIEQLLTHTAGIADPFELGGPVEEFVNRKTAGNYPAFTKEPLTMKPGEFHRYSNGNYSVLAMVVEQVSGVSFVDYLKENIFKPAGMAIYKTEEYTKLPRAVNYSYRPENDPLGVETRTPVGDPEKRQQFEYSGFSNSYLTAEDVYLFMLALNSGKLLSPEMTDMVTSGKVEIQKGAPVKYGYGFYEANMWGVKMCGHSGGGGNSGIGAEAEMIRDKGWFVVVLGNYDLEVVRPLTFSIVRFLGGRD